MVRTSRLTLAAFVSAALVCAAILIATSLSAQESQRPGTAVHYASIPAGAYSVVAEVRAKPGKEAELRAATVPLIRLVRSDPANLVYFLQEDRDSPGHFIFYEVFATQKDFEAHNNMPYVKAWFAKLSELARGGVEVMRMEVLTESRK
jgi:quinol monooxygenase YgiN